MTRHHVRCRNFIRHKVSNHRMEKDGRLRDFRLLQILLGAAEHHIGDAETEHRIGFFKQFLCRQIIVVQVFAHSDKLRPLTGENVCSHHSLLLV